MMVKRMNRVAWGVAAILGTAARGGTGANAGPYGVEQRRLGPSRRLVCVYNRHTKRTIWARTVISPNGIDVLRWSPDGLAVGMADAPPTRLILWREGKRVHFLRFYPSQGVE